MKWQARDGKICHCPSVLVLLINVFLSTEGDKKGADGISKLPFSIHSWLSCWCLEALVLAAICVGNPHMMRAAPGNETWVHLMEDSSTTSAAGGCPCGSAASIPHFVPVPPSFPLVKWAWWGQLSFSLILLVPLHLFWRNCLCSKERQRSRAFAASNVKGLVLKAGCLAFVPCLYLSKLLSAYPNFVWS